MGIVSLLSRPMDPTFRNATKPRLSTMQAALLLVPLGSGCGARESQKKAQAEAQNPQKAEAPAPSAPDQEKNTPALWSWVDSRAPLVMMWRPPHHNAPVLADVFAFPARAAQFYEQAQRRAKDTERFLEAPLDAPELVAFSGGSLPDMVTVIRISQADHDALAAKIRQAPERTKAFHEWTCATPRAQHHESLCLLDAPDIAWVPSQAPARALDLLRMTRDLPASPLQKALAESMNESPKPIALLFSFTPSLHLELDEDPSSFHWTLASFGKADAQGRPGWTGKSRMQHADPQAAITRLKKAQGLSDAPKAKALRQRAHLESPAPKLVEIHLEVHGDDPQAP